MRAHRHTALPAALALALCLAAGCGGDDDDDGGADGDSDADADADTDADGDADLDTSCTVDDDCVLVARTCCPCGRILSVNRSSEQSARDAYEPDPNDCANQPCGDVFCIGSLPICEAGTCGVTDEGYHGCDPLGEYCGMSQYCVERRARTLADACAGAGGARLFGCHDASDECPAESTCAIDPEDGAELVFEDACVPDGWAACAFECAR